MTLVKQL